MIEAVADALVAELELGARPPLSFTIRIPSTWWREEDRDDCGMVIRVAGHRVRVTDDEPPEAPCSVTH